MPLEPSNATPLQVFILILIALIYAYIHNKWGIEDDEK